MKDNMIWIKTALIGCIVIFAACMLMGGRGANSNANVSDVEMKILGSVDMGTLTKSTSQMAKKVFGINPGDYEDLIYYQGSGVMDVNELLIVKLSDTAQAETLENAINTRVSTQIQSFTGYGEDQVHLLNQAVVQVRGNFVFYSVSPVAQSYRDIFLDAL